MLLFSALALAQSSPPPPIVGGAPDADNPAVGMVAWLDQDGSHLFCSGTLIAPQWVLTSASCAAQAQQYLDQGLAVDLMLGLNLYQLDEQLALEEAIPFPEWEDVGSDVGLLRLASAAQVSPAPWNLQTLTPEYEGSTLSYIGFGITQTGASDAGFRRITQVPVERVTARAIWGYHGDVDAPRGICEQDFGGPALLEVEGVLTVVGVNAEVLLDGQSADPCKGYAISARTDVHAQWVQELTLGLIDTGTLDTGPAVQVFEAVPRDCGGCGGGQAPIAPALVLAALALLCRRKSSAVAH